MENGFQAGVPRCGSRPRGTRPGEGFFFTLVLIVATSVLFFIFDCPFLTAHVTVAVPVIGAVLLFFVLSSFLHTAFTDPGILPRATPSEATALERQIRSQLPPHTLDVFINGQLVKLKYCLTCKIFRPPRASHCSICDNCVDRFDHHCPWVGNCVGQRNYPSFYLFLLSLTLLSSLVLAAVTTHVVMRSQTSSFVKVVKETPASAAEFFICLFTVWPVLCLTGFHTYLVATNVTTHEDIKHSLKSRKGSERMINPYSHKKIVTNCCATLCGPRLPSFLGTAQVLEEHSERGMGDAFQDFAISCTI
ncbi:palmitoyltransferase ZDHHC18 isoform X1 [Bombina bombina]|uniref:palmitoyltransferase ZDHHC18 isoform X1 n=1 Tax=Bombina bombina TaxID=8345 RepID=UPI00235AF4A4|nr:palmitoyltransferase ZDHHC18 isoform X1 [Bombina bombina]